MMRRYCKTYVLVGQLLTLLFLFSSAVSISADDTATQTKRVLSITGRMDEGFYVRFAVQYTPVKDTKVLCTKFEPLAGFWVPRYRTFYYDAVSRNGEYTLDVPLSEMPPGQCEWRAGMISYAISDTQKFSTYISLVAIDNTNGQLATSIGQRVTSITYYCRKAVPFCSGNLARGFRYITKDQETLEMNFLAARSAQ